MRYKRFWQKNHLHVGVNDIMDSHVLLFDGKQRCHRYHLSILLVSTLEKDQTSSTSHSEHLGEHVLQINGDRMEKTIEIRLRCDSSFNVKSS